MISSIPQLQEELRKYSITDLVIDYRQSQALCQFYILSPFYIANAEFLHRLYRRQKKLECQVQLRRKPFGFFCVTTNSFCEMPSFVKNSFSIFTVSSFTFINS